MSTRTAAWHNLGNVIAATLLLCFTGFAADTSLPDPLTLLKHVQAHQAQMDAVRDNYTFHRLRRVSDVEKDGKVN